MTVNKKYIQTNELQNLIDWKNIMEMSRDAGGHCEQMKGLFKNAKVVAHYRSGGYSGEVATCVQLENGRYAIYNDYYGSCSGCDSWQEADDEEVIYMCKNLANGAYVFQNLKDVIDFLSSDIDISSSWYRLTGYDYESEDYDQDYTGTDYFLKLIKKSKLYDSK